MRSKLPDWEGTEKACIRAIQEYDKTIVTYLNPVLRADS
jgi:hypothetical protein